MDDDLDFLALSRLSLEKQGFFSIHTCESARDALAFLVKHPVDAIISDYKMLDMDGIDFLKTLRRQGDRTPFIIFTGKDEKDLAARAFENGVDFITQKAGDPKTAYADLVHKVRMAIHQRIIEARIRDHERREADILNFLPDAIFAIDTSGEVIAWNRAMEKMTGIPAADILGKGDYEYAVPFYGKRRPILIDMVFNGEETVSGNYPYIGKENDKYFSEIYIPHLNCGRGAYLWFTASPLYDSAGEVSGAIESIRDITNRKWTEEKLKKREEELAAALEASGVGLWDWQIQAGIVECNEHFAEIVGYPVEEVTAIPFKAWIQIAHADDLKRFNEQIYRHFSSRLPLYEDEIRLHHRDGHLVWVLIRGKVVAWDGLGHPLRMTGTAMDITERKRNEAEIEASLREKETLIKEIHHRVKNNMQVISSLLLLQRKQIGDPAIRTLFQESENRVFSITLVHEKLYRSKDLSQVDIQDHFQTMGEYLLASFGIEPGRIALDIHAEGVFLPIDRAVPLSLITNELLTNSLKHAFPDERNGKVHISLVQENGTLRYLFHDDGVGFPPGLDFKNTESLGMQLVNGLVGQILGSITMQQEEGTGFEIVFSRAVDTEDNL
ncbi:MAG: PAS domain S-box protein [Methanoregulaceae archaeon]